LIFLLSKIFGALSLNFGLCGHQALCIVYLMVYPSPGVSYETDLLIVTIYVIQINCQNCLQFVCCFAPETDVEKRSLTEEEAGTGSLDCFPKKKSSVVCPSQLIYYVSLKNRSINKKMDF
jgi:hypothetical protein